MSRIAYVNGRYVRHAEAAVHVEDRGFQFADGVYEVTAVRGGRLVDEGPHLDRLERSLRELRIPLPMSRAALLVAMRETARRNRVRDGIVYLQVNRGAARRDHAFPAAVEPSVVITARPQSGAAGERLAASGAAVVSMPDIRWGRCDIKSVSLLPNILAKQAAKEQGAFEAWLIDRDGFVTEGSSTNAWIVDRAGALRTRSLENAILSGITRQVLLEVARENGTPVEERKFTLDEALQAREAFLTSTTSFVMPVVRIDGKAVADGKPGPLTRTLRALYERRVLG